MVFKKFLSKGFIAIAVVAAVITLSVIGGLLYFRSQTSSADKSSKGYQELDPPDVNTLFPPSESPLGQFTKAAVVSNGQPCAAIGRAVLEKNGSAVDALIATMLCDGVNLPQAMGIGGGFFMTLYVKANNSVVTLNSRETAPAAATEGMFNGSSTASQDGALAVAVPGELKGYYEAWKRYGKLNWSELFEPTIKMCEEGITVSQSLAQEMETVREQILAIEALRNIFVVNNTLVRIGDNITLPKLAQTMRVVAYGNLKADELYNGSLTDGLVKDIQNGGGIITREDLNNYSPEWQDPITANLSGGLTMYSMPLPGSGVLVSFILRLLDGFLQNATTELQIKQRITEAFKHAYGRRSNLGDPHYYDVSKVMNDLSSEEYIKQVRSKISDHTTSQNSSYYGAHYSQLLDHGTANIVVLAPNGDAAVGTSTVNLIFGSKFVSESTGIVLNNQMDDFSSTYQNFFGVSPSPANYIKPGKRPMSSMCPTIFVDSNGDVRLALGSAGGTKITTSTSLVSIYNLWYNKTIKEAIDAPRIHHQLEPMKLYYEYGTLKEFVKGMEKIGHSVERLKIDTIWKSFVTAVACKGHNVVQANADFRRPGSIDGF